jgi:Domain of unknown function (DUF4145)
MTILGFIASVIGSLAWPAAIVCCLYLFRERLSELLPLLRVKRGDLEFSFRLTEVEKEAKELPAPERDQKLAPIPEEKTKFETVAKMNPRAAILDKRNELEDALFKALYRAGQPPPRVMSMLTGIRMLRNSQLISASIASLLEDLRVLGNNAAHDRDFQPTLDDALRFGELADRVMESLLPIGD